MKKVFMDFFEEKEFTQSEFIDSLGNIEDISAFELLDRMSVLNKINRESLLKNDLIKFKLRDGLLIESRNDQWHYYREIFKKISLLEFLSLYDSDYLIEYFKKYNKEKYKFYATCCEVNINVFIDYILNDKEIYEHFFECSSYFSSLFDKISYDNLKEVVLKMQNYGFKLSNDFFSDVPDEIKIKIINEKDFNNDTIVFILPKLHNEYLNLFFKNDPRALYLYDKFNVDDLIKRGIEFNDNILKKKEFFELLKKDSLIEFRRTINNLEKINNPVILEERINEYYTEIINSYDYDNGLFKDYTEILDNPGNEKINNSYIFDFEVVCKISQYLRQDQDGKYYYERYDELLMFLKNETSKKLSEVIIDTLFRDNIYNVWINIKEMLRYNSMLDDSDKLLDMDKVNFYKTILNFDNINNEIKIEFYNNYKDKNLNLLFYNDLRKIKDKAYDNIKDSLINPGLHSEYIDENLSEKYGVQVYDLCDKQFTMLVRTSAEFKDIVHYRRGCYSIISNENTQVFGECDTDSFVYGYASFDNDYVLHMFESDSFSFNYKDEPTRYVNRIMTAEELVKANNSYSEVQILNEANTEHKNRWNAKKPDFIVVFNAISDKYVKESKRLDIPIVIIKKNKLDKDDIIDIGFDAGIDAYVRTTFEENERRMRR